jgi:GTP pyrophosphokinase
MLRQYELVERVKAYDPTADEGLLNRAYVFTVKAHGAQLRHSGDPYFSHPVEVAGILTDLKLDSATIITALLHDVIEDTTATPEEIETLFGADVARLVDGVTKLSRVEWSSEATKQAENFRKLLIAMSSDIRVLLVKLADRLHNMRTLRFIPKAEKRKRIAQETMEIYAPLADRMGMHEIREELEDLAFAELNPDARLSIMSRLAFLKEQGGDVVQRISDQIKRTLAQQGLDAWVIGREKRPFSIWHKMERKSVSFEALADIIGFRIVVKEASDCYRALGILHGTWPAVPLRFKDYVSLPKRNGYRSLHTTIIGPEGHRIEIQIRTLEMHEIAERGVAAHWSYKDYVSADPSRAGNPYNFLRELVEMLEHGGSAEEFLEHTKLEMFQDQVFCFTPKGDLIALPRGASAIDFAYAVHTEVGDTCVGAKINGRAMPLRTILNNGDSVEIIRSKAQHPLPSWSSLVVTGKARSAIRRFTRLAEREEFSRLGKGIVERVFRDAGYEATEKVLEPLLPQFKQPKLTDLYVAVGRGTLPPESLLEAVLGDGGANGKGRKSRLPRMLRRGKSVNGTHGPAIPIRGLSPGLAMHMSPCCHPLPGERIVGIKLPGKGVAVHTIDCPTLDKEHDGDRWIDLTWESDADEHGPQVGQIDAVLANEPGALGLLCTVIARQGGNISNLKITDRTSDFFEFLVDVEVGDVKHLNTIIAALNATPSVSSVKRVRG